MKKVSRFIIFLILIPVVSKAQFISEIMYDLDGADSGFEWVEIYNDSGDFDITTWRFFEGETNHKINLIEGSEIISNGGTAVIADNASKFLEKNPGFSGNLFDSSFSLSNTGETLILKDSDLNEIFSVSYISDWGANGDGQSLNFSEGSWVALSPTPGSHNSPSPPSSSSGTESESSDEGETLNTSSPDSHPVTPQIEIRAKGEELVIVGAHALYEAQVFGLEEDLIENARVLWNFGDGSIKEGGKILYNFKYPGDYVVVANGSSGEFSASARISVKAIPSAVLVSGLDDKNGEFIKIRNDSDKEINLSWWIIKGGRKSFSIPENTFILPKTEIILAKSTTGIDSRERPLEILYPNGLVAYSFVDFDESGISLAPAGSSRPTRPVGGQSPSPASRTSSSPPPQVNEETLEDSKNDSLVAAPALNIRDNEEAEGDGKALWYTLFILLLSGSVATAILSRRKIFNKEANSKKKSLVVDDIEIIE